jgi:hypothetical protein
MRWLDLVTLPDEKSITNAIRNLDNHQKAELTEMTMSFLRVSESQLHDFVLRVLIERYVLF